jgi:hypothetical protein
MKKHENKFFREKENDGHEKLGFTKIKMFEKE